MKKKIRDVYQRGFSRYSGEQHIIEEHYGIGLGPGKRLTKVKVGVEGHEHNKRKTTESEETGSFRTRFAPTISKD